MGPPPPKPREVRAPVWAVLISYAVGWLIGGYILLHEVNGAGRLSVMLVGAWLVILPMAGAKPLDVLRQALGGGGK